MITYEGKSSGSESGASVSICLLLVGVFGLRLSGELGKAMGDELPTVYPKSANNSIGLQRDRYLETAASCPLLSA